MGAYIAKKTVQLLVKQGKDISDSKVLVMGATFKENVEDIRNSKVVDVINELISFSVKVDVVDPIASPLEFKHEYNLDLLKKAGKNYDAVILAVSHKEYCNLDPAWFNSITRKNAIFVDIKGLYRNKIKNMTYWSL